MQVLSDVGVARWKAKKGQVTYNKTDGHTLSLYLSGGETSCRADNKDIKGAPGRFCLMPKNHDSQWHINDEISFVHLYFSDESLKHFAATTFDADVRFIEIQDLIYQQDASLKQFFLEYFAHCDQGAFSSPLYAEQAMHKVLHHLLKHYNGFDVKEQIISGGLSPSHRRIIKELIHHGTDDKLTIERLANTIGLSQFHFARMFKMSFGESPASYITRIRVEKSKSLLTTHYSLADISVQTGFANQSHMTRHFKKYTGITPAAYRQALQN